MPAREHRCGATDPPGRLPLDKQQNLCLVASHLDCPLFEAAAGLTVGSHLQEAARAAAELDPRAVPAALPAAWRPDKDAPEEPAFVRAHRPIPRTTPVILDRARPAVDMHLPQFKLPSMSFRRSASAPAVLREDGLPLTRLAELRAGRERTRANGDAGGLTTAGAVGRLGDGLAEKDIFARTASIANSHPGDQSATGDGPVTARGALDPSSSGHGGGPGRGGASSGGSDRGSAGAGHGAAGSGHSGGGGNGGGGNGGGGRRFSFGRGPEDGDDDNDLDAAHDGAHGARPSDSGGTTPPRRRPTIPGRRPAGGVADAAAPRTTTPVGPRRFMPPGGVNGFRSLGRVGGGARGTGGFEGIRAALAGREIQAALAGLMGLALVLVLVVRFSGGGAAGVAGASSSPRPSAGATARPSGAAPSGSAAASTGPSSGATAGVSARPSAKPTAKPTPKPTKTPAAARTYRVKPGDTLSGIAATFRTTIATLMRLNNITDPRTLRTGQVLKLP